MKTININLIGEYSKTVKSTRLEIKRDTLDPRTRIILIIVILGTFITLAASLGIWLIANSLSAVYAKKLQKMSIELAELQKEEIFLSEYGRDIKIKKKIAELKILGRNQVNNLYIPWSVILKDLAAKVPKNIIITDIKKITNARTGNKLTISGVVPAKDKPLTAVSFLILNINEDKNSLLINAKIKKVDYDKDSDLYEFEVETDLDQAKQE